ncbi:hypothetical protein CSA37_05120 [Candidatus Fermentibacteria bacterium]|nr:MAG: hypothetical protein CSA37_05120 [Candidatus Fermentibacteria bacterium]
MRCPDISELSLYLDGELAEESRVTIEEHLSECSDCRAWLAAQKRMETLWRESWQDPEESAFDIMISGVLRTVPWWKKQRSWMAAAAVFAVYFGVRVFMTGDAGRPLSEAAQEELSGGMPSSELPVSEIPYEDEADAMETADQSEPAEEMCLAYNTPVQESIEETSEEQVSPSEILNSEESFANQEIDEVSSGALEAESSYESGLVYELEDSFSESSESSHGGSGALEAEFSSLERSSSEVPDNDFSQVDQDHCRSAGEPVAETAAVTQGYGTDFSYTVTLITEEGDSTMLSRNSWPELFRFLDDYLAENSLDRYEMSFTLNSETNTWSSAETELPEFDFPAEWSVGSTITVHLH